MADRFRREQMFLDAIPFAVRAARVRSASVIAVCSPAILAWEDLAQEVLIAVWHALTHFDPSRASLRTYVERVAASKIASILRRAHAAKRTKRERYPVHDSIELLVTVDVRLDVRRALRGLTHLDSKVGLLLLRDYRPAEIARTLKISRPEIYRSIDRIRGALVTGGFK